MTYGGHGVFRKTIIVPSPVFTCYPQILLWHAWLLILGLEVSSGTCGGFLEACALTKDRLLLLRTIKRIFIQGEAKVRLSDKREKSVYSLQPHRLRDVHGF